MDTDDPQQDDPGVLRTYALVGLAATQFSALEFHIQFLLSFLHNGKELSVETVIFTRRSTFFQKITLIEELIRLRLHDKKELLEKGLVLTSELQTLRKKRNLFIHGYWTINNIAVATGLVNVSDANWDYDPKAVSYQTMTSTNFTLKELEEMPFAIGALTQRCHDYLTEVKQSYRTTNPGEKSDPVSP